MTLINTLFHEQDAGATTLLRPLNIDVTALGQSDSRSLMSPRSHTNGEDALRHQVDDQGLGTFQVPGCASIVMKDSAGTSMSLNLGIDPTTRTPILSGRAIDAHGSVLDVHPCSCNDPISSRHKLPGSPELFRGGAHNHLYSSPKPPFGAHRRPIPSPMPLIVLQTQLTHSPSHPEPQGSEYEAPVPDTTVDVLSPFTPTPASVQQRSQSTGSDPNERFYTPPMGPEDTSSPHQTTVLPEPSADPPPSSRKVALNLRTIPEQSLFSSDVGTPIVRSPSSVSVRSEMSGPSALGPIPSLPSSPSYTASERSTRTVIPLSHPVPSVCLNLEQLNAERIVNDPLHGNASSQGNGVLAVADPALLGYAGGSSRAANVNTLAHNEITSVDDLYANNHHGSVDNLGSGLYTDRIVASPSPSMPVPRIGPDGQELRYNLETPSFSDLTQVYIHVLNSSL